MSDDVTDYRFKGYRNFAIGVVQLPLAATATHWWGVALFIGAALVCFGTGFAYLTARRFQEKGAGSEDI